MISAIKEGQRAKLKENSDPIDEDTSLVVKLEACGICGSDLGNITGNSSKPTEKIGHEISGTIIGKGKRVHNFQVGDRVFVHHHASCNECYFCRHGNQTMCEKFVDSLEPCGLSEKFLVPAWILKKGTILKIPDSMTFEEAAMIEPLACCVRALKKISVSNNDSMVIFGAGSIGAMHGMLGKYFGMRQIYFIDPNDSRLNFIEKNNIGIPLRFNSQQIQKMILDQTNNRGVDLAIIATSNMETIKNACNLVRKGGKILLFGEPKNDSKILLDFSTIYSKEISIISTYAASTNDVTKAFDLINKKLVNVEQLITHQFPISALSHALEQAQSGKNSMKIVIRPDQ